MVDKKNKIDLGSLGNKDENKLTFEEENNQYAGEDITVIII